MSCPNRGVAALAFLLAATLALPAAAQDLIPQPPMAEAVASLPRVDGNRRANAALQALDDLHLGFLICDDGSLDGSSRTIQPTSTGPEVLTFLIDLGSECQGGQPWLERQIVSFDLASGRQTDLTDYLPADWIGTGTPEFPLYDLYLATLGPQLSDDCRQGLERAMTDGRLRFDIGPDSGQQRLLVLPVGLPPADAACAVPAGVDAATLAAAGFAPNLIRAVRGTMP